MNFVMSEQTRAALNAALAPLDVEQRAKALDAIASLGAEMTLHIQRESAEFIRVQWSDAMASMYRRLSVHP